MRLLSFLLCLSLVASVKCAAGGDWCYGGCEHTPSHWGDISGAFCGGQRQSPVNIIPSLAQTDPQLHNFTFVNFSSPHTLKSITNTGKTVKCILEENQVEVSGGGLNGTYSTVQFHFHWGDTEHHPGSEHMIDGHRYPMEMHIVSLKKGFSVEDATAHPEGIAVLGFFMNATEDGDMLGPWGNFTSLLTRTISSEIEINYTISIDDLIENVNLTKFYRYKGSLTTPNCNEAVMWTVFQEPININKKLLERFPAKAGYTNVYRPTQPLNGRRVFASPATPLPPSPPWCYDDHCEYTPSNWHLLRYAHCDGERQSPINIEAKKAVEDKHLVEFTYTKFDDKHSMKYIINTGHTVKVVLKEDLVEVSGGGLGHVYSTLQLHFHWGTESHDGSEHTMDAKRYPMEMHIVNKRKDLTVEEAKQTPNGLAVLGFFIEHKGTHKSSSGSEHSETSTTSDTDPWKKLTDHFSAIQNISSKVNVTEEISIDDLLGEVNRGEYYRYNGSLTTPTCDEAVVWTVFKESIKVDEKLMTKFSTEAGYHNVYRPTQLLHNRKVYSTKSASSASGPITLLLLLACLYTFSYNLHM
ncbi:uncharacterized protein LOC117246865 [Epinephelus lanceolatus]|uniref:carbonic anhydrase 4-like n=1 Tax=Epinephelus lanceolatus TaxID=310571 RepID=UPI0014467AFB|nr:carbonic anhydrase 4-like [Epinephelus lanceolatus]XP_033466763.1 carbonic anhydrase 4-like [Epinephelus lanceolatus]